MDSGRGKRAGGWPWSRLFVAVPAPVAALMVLMVVAAGLYSFAFVTVTRPPSGYLAWWDGWLRLLVATLPVVVVGARAVTDRRQRRAWWCLTAGALAVATGGAMYVLHDRTVMTWTILPPSDLAYFAAYALWSVGIALLAYREATDISRDSLLDGLATGLTVCAVLVALWFAPVLGSGAARAQVLSAVGYRTFDLILVLVVLVSLSALRYRPSPALAAISVGAAAFAVGDIVHLDGVATGVASSTGSAELTWVAGMVILAFGVWMRPAPRVRGRVGEDSLSTKVPGFAALVAGGVLVLGMTRTIPVLASMLAVASFLLTRLRLRWTMKELWRSNENFRQARTDDLTGLANRRSFVEGLDRLLAHSEGPVAVLLVDLDGFKEVNDSLGHPAGDRLLQVLARRFGQRSGREVSIARLGGDEFALAGELDVAGGEALALRLQLSLLDPVALDGMSVRVGASIGLAYRSPGGHESRDELMRQVDVAMYRSKHEGTPHEWYDPATDRGRGRLELVEDLRCAIDDQAFSMEFQPLFGVATGAIVGMEALMRWDHPTRGRVPPSDFVLLAEQVGLVPRLTRVAVGLSLDHLQRVRSAGWDLGVSINISAKDLVDEELVLAITQALEMRGLDPHWLTLEITETAVASDPVRAARTLRLLRAKGIRVSIDDFGVGYSSLSQLLGMPLDELKIDRTFITSVAEDLRAQAILGSTVGLGKTLGLNVVAEGVETASSWDEVRRHGVDVAQGFYLARPMAPDAFMAHLAATLIDADEISHS